jgi:hypothetical protein
MISAATITTTRSTLTTTILRSSSRCLSSTAAATGGSESSLTNQSSEKNEIKIPKYYDALRVEGRKQMSPQRVKELAEYGRQKSIEAKSKSRKFSFFYPFIFKIYSTRFSLLPFSNLPYSIAHNIHGLLHRGH